MIFTPLPLDGAYRIDLEPHGDDRGFFARQFCATEFAAHGLATDWVQCNTSLSRVTGTVRGMHFQRRPRSEAKLVRCLRGALFDVIVDLRAGAPTFGAWTALELSAENRAAIYVPEGFAHGFQSLEPDTEILYFVSASYSPAHEGGVHHADPEIGIRWPLPVSVLSPRDAALPALADVGPPA